MGPGIREKKQETSAGHHLFTYHGSGVGRKGRIMDDMASILDVYGPYIERTFELVLFPE
jgi:hypothetical protein